MLLLLLSCALRAPAPAPVPATPPPAPPTATLDRGTQWVHGSAEFDAVLATVYSDARDELSERAQALPEGTPWAVISDVDETLIDNSAYQVQTMGQFSPETWAVWEAEGQAVALPGAVELLAHVRLLGGRMAFVTNRSNHPATLALLQERGLWSEGDVLCVRVDSSDKSARRQSVLEGGELCGWPGEPVQVLAYWGDQMGDFPGQDAGASEPDPWGESWFMLPNPMYGSWAE